MNRQKPKRTVAELMIPHVICLRPETTVREARETLAKRRVSGAPVVDEHGRPIGVISQTDLVRANVEAVTAAQAGRFYSDVEDYQEIAEQHVDRSEMPIASLMSRDVWTVSRDTGVAIAASVMRERRVHRLLVTERGVLVGIVTALDLMRIVEELG